VFSSHERKEFASPRTQCSAADDVADDAAKKYYVRGGEVDEANKNVRIEREFRRKSGTSCRLSDMFGL
jgi:hypothetical protein